MSARTIGFVTRPGCSLCEEMRPAAEAAARRAGFGLRIVDVDRAGLTERYGDRVPVVLGPGGSVLAEGWFATASLWRRLLGVRLSRFVTLRRVGAPRR
jgi:hypothetical protein